MESKKPTPIKKPKPKKQAQTSNSKKIISLSTVMISLMISSLLAYQYYQRHETDSEKPQSQITIKEPSSSIYKDCAQCPTMVVLPSGSFNMGNNDGREDEKPVHRVKIKQFAMGQTEVTFNQWDGCYNAGGCKHKAGDEGWGRGSLPVINVSWDDAQEYIKWISNKTGKSYRLPSEAEWEYAARAGSTTKYSWGDNISCSQADYNYNICNIIGTSPVKSYSANSFGLYDMHGNVWERVEDKFNKDYNGAPKDGSAWISGYSAFRVLRGGSWKDSAAYLRSADRKSNTVNNRNNIDGFRLAKDK